MDTNAAAVKALARLGARQYVPQLVKQVGSNFYDAQPTDPVGDALIELGPLGTNDLVGALAPIYADRSRLQKLRALSHVLGGGEQAAETLIGWLGFPEHPVDMKITHEAGLESLRIFQSVWDSSHAYADAQRVLAEDTIAVARGVSWRQTDVSTLEASLRQLQSVQATQADALNNTIKSLQRWRYLESFGVLWLVHGVRLPGTSLKVSDSRSS